MKLAELLESKGVCISTRGGGDWRPKSLLHLENEELPKLKSDIRKLEQALLETLVRVSDLEDKVKGEGVRK